MVKDLRRNKAQDLRLKAQDLSGLKAKEGHEPCRP
jgi:hypothetical protein